METLMFKLTWPEISEYLKENDIVLFPVGSTEQHGRHIAEDMDAFMAFEVAKRVAEKTGVLVAPPMPFGFSVHHMNFPGTITLSFKTLVNVYKEVCESLLNHGFKKIVVINGHGGNINVISQALREVREETGALCYSFLAVPIKDGFGSESLQILEQEGGGHACEMETSVAQYLGQRVIFERAQKWKPPDDQKEFLRKYRGKVIMPFNLDEITESGALGDPTLASEEKGEKLVEAVIKDISNFINELKTDKC